ncbi:DUF4232 domain-containing protein [Streptomyces inhibens]|uniref:DUF4232 domain-containing protein n=1 Tax=Streptomyces inhibens TaxID=2293571 RepID=A0A371PTV9_STRIH|nr:DUF4232 domain-containing protein [Streptomyces inhibens]REK85918.1 DUF4232 domain-containing protein [Streptomyces inhibens]
MPFTVTATARRAVAAGLTAAALSLTAACHGGAGTKADDSATAVSPVPTSPSPGGDGALSPRPGGRAACTPEMLRFHAGAMPRRDHRMLLTVTNYSDRTCDFATQRYPLLRFGEGRRPAVPAIENSRPHSVVTLAPNATAYATVTTSTAGGPHGRGRKISQFGVALAARATPTQVGLDDGAPVHVDPRAARVTYWLPSLTAALKW